MEMGFSPEQELLLQGLMMLGCDKYTQLVIMATLDSPEAVMEMLQYMVENQESTPKQLYKMSSKISSNRRNQPEYDEKEDGDWDE